MSRSALQIASTALEDIWEAQDAFDKLHDLFTVMTEKLPADSLGCNFAQLGKAVVSDWGVRFHQYADCMHDELDPLWNQNVATPGRPPLNSVATGEGGQ